MRVYFEWGTKIRRSRRKGDFGLFEKREMTFEVSSAAELVALRRKHKPMWVMLGMKYYMARCDMVAIFYRLALADPELSPIVQDALLAQRREESTRPPKGTRI